MTTETPWHRWVLDPMVAWCKSRARVALLEALAFTAAGDDVHARRAALAHVFWVRAAFAMSPRPTPELTIALGPYKET